MASTTTAGTSGAGRAAAARASRTRPAPTATAATARAKASVRVVATTLPIAAPSQRRTSAPRRHRPIAATRTKRHTQGQADSDGHGVYGKPGTFYEHQDVAAGERGGAYAPGAAETDPRFSGVDGGRTDRFGGRGDQMRDDKAGWRAVGDANPDGLIGGEDEKPSDGDPLGAGVR